MSILPQLEHDLLEAANRKLAASGGADGNGEPSRSRRAALGGMHRLRLPLLALGGLLATTTIALAATGVILTGAPVHPEESLNPSIGEGIPAPGASKLLPLRVPDPAGGLPWGMRIVHTTRGEVCVQIGRVQAGQLGELGIDGNFHDDGRFHPIPADALPRDVFRGHVVPLSLSASQITNCHLSGRAIEGELIGIDPSARLSRSVARNAAASLLDIYYGILGPRAVSVTYGDGAEHRTETVIPGTGAYLIVQPRTPAQHEVGMSGTGSGTQGQLLSPLRPFTAFTYRLHGELCQMGFPDAASHLAACPEPPGPTASAGAQDLRRPLQVHLQISHHLITGATLSFTAPFAVTSASTDYSYAIPLPARCSRTSQVRNGKALRVASFTGERLGRNVARGALVTWHIEDPFGYGCGGRSTTVEVFYGHKPEIDVPEVEGRIGSGELLVGSVAITEPPGTRPARSQVERPGTQTP